MYSAGCAPCSYRKRRRRGRLSMRWSPRRYWRFRYHWPFFGEQASVGHLRSWSRRQRRMGSMRWDCSISHCFETRAQASVEAAFLLPCFLTLLLLTLQPVFLLYTRSVMESAAAETARLMITSEGTDEESLKAFAFRRLAAVPNVAIFHTGGPLSWDIALAQAGESTECVNVEITGHVRPLPILGAFVQGFGKTNAQGDVELRVSVAYNGRPSWLEGGYDS